MLLTPRIIAIDDESAHLAGLAESLNRHGVACLQILFTEDPVNIMPCPDVRLIFADLHLGGGSLSSDHKTDFSTIGTLLEDTIKPSGPYFIVLWTMYPDQAPKLHKFLDRLEGVTKPFDVLPLSKTSHLDSKGKVRNENELIKAIVNLTNSLPQIAVLFDWENRVLDATGSTVSSLLELASTHQSDNRTGEVGRILARLAIEAVGEDHVDSDRLRALNNALLPILADRLANTRLDKDNNEIWRKAFDVVSSRELSQEEAAQLNRLVHVANAEGNNGRDRGAVILLTGRDENDFKEDFGLDQNEAAQREFHCKDFALDENRSRWVLVQAQAACDHAQTRPGPVPFYLGLDLPEAQIRRTRKPPASLWRSPVFRFGGDIRRLHVSARFPMSLSPSAANRATPLYRLREQILNGLIFHLHGHTARPGMISFRKTR